MENTLEFNQLEELANRFKILSDPSRLHIIQAICIHERTVTEICDHTQLNQANVSKHLQFLKIAGVVACRRVGNCRYYRIIDADLLKLCREANRQLAQDSSISSAC
jgi:DNA-binding transcriptional ArsR family regulator